MGSGGSDKEGDFGYGVGMVGIWRVSKHRNTYREER